jgi:hypothetical protein
MSEPEILEVKIKRFKLPWNKILAHLKRCSSAITDKELYCSPHRPGLHIVSSDDVMNKDIVHMVNHVRSQTIHRTDTQRL